MLTKEMMYKAIIEKDISFEGTFITAVKTTGIFCRPTCTARKPKAENVEFFKTTSEAILKGYRPCKVCNPLEKIGETPDSIKEILNALNADPSLKFKDWDLIQKGIEPSAIRRWFLKNHGITFHAYQRMFRINAAFKKIQEGEAVTAVAFGAGYESLSGFGDSFKSVFGVSPSNSKDKQVINITRLETPLGTMFACAVEQGICLLEFTDRKMLETELKTLAKRLNANIILGANRHFDLLKQELDEYFEGKRKQFTVPLFTPGTAFQQLVWKTLQTIPYGATHSYKQQSIAINNPEAVRAVANANGMNRISIIIPCHRVIGEDGKLMGYGGGLFRKKWLLDMEKSNC
ncbi:AraC family transcriptional regulator, regulatory protein of adaptative response / methylated-DNA-[protein]-cysteine methyltransferase [Chitinophaga sp. YR573]|uniref:bifunctional transcriptional activator/DNA repair enzyme AdaA n=1 Tax=Chitinophaga sp. YR573 TaxID=1881040 RepID=UPI0008B5EC8C|nr:methylated-DNA--[protein]-cysteine S-methyltransferase [Chitinophaga sp. YR573]SEV96186.1 AraC family transcriptional regulator, regulatory protein of adaptative response / methylated-DNA-[protein]-cysteine methyltransferase [Chitinophaga sp. YR573]